MPGPGPGVHATDSTAHVDLARTSKRKPGQAGAFHTVPWTVCSLCTGGPYPYTLAASILLPGLADRCLTFAQYC